MLREACVIIPVMGRGPVTDLHVRTVLQTSKEWLTEAFGGVTVTMGHGCWRNPDNGETEQEPVAIYTVAVDPGKPYARPLRRVINMVGGVLRQQAVYYRTPDGRVTLVPTGYLWQQLPAPTVPEMPPKVDTAPLTEALKGLKAQMSAA